jgi:hypothetical protein
VAHACDPSYSVGRDQEEDHGLKSAWRNRSLDLISKKKNKKTITKKEVAQSVGPEFKH